LICVSGLSALSKMVIRGAGAAAHFKVSVSFVVNLVRAVRSRGSFEPKPSGGRRHAKLEPHRSFLLAQVAEKADITMPELAAELAAATGEKADPA
jgi:transposase